MAKIVIIRKDSIKEYEDIGDWQFDHGSAVTFLKMHKTSTPFNETLYIPINNDVLEINISDFIE